MNIKMKLVRNFAILAILLSGIAVLIPYERVQAQDCSYCMTERTACMNYCSTLSPEDYRICRDGCFADYLECLALCSNS